MINLTPRLISKASPSRSVYNRGLQYYRRGAVEDLYFDEETGYFEAQVEGTYLYHVSVQLESPNSISASCSCPAFARYDGFCKHIIAVLLALSVNAHPKYSGTGEEEGVAQLLDHYAGKTGHGEALAEIRVTLFVRVVHHLRYGRWHFYISLKIGETRQYVVRNVHDLIDAIARRRPLYYGKQFTLDLSEQRFTPESRRIIDFLMQIYEVSAQGYYGTGPGLLKGKEIELGENLFRRLLLQIGELPFTLDLGNRTYHNVTVAKAALPMRFSLEEEESGLILGLRETGEVFPLNDQCDLLFHKDKIHYLPATPQKELIPLLQELNKGTTGEIHIGKTQMQRFFSGLHPLIEKTAAITASPSLEKRLRHLPLESKVYLDYEGGAVSAKLEFVYGESVINPFAATEPKTQNPDDSILIRDLAAEQEVMRFFEEAEFRVMGKAMYLDEDEKIYEFIYEMIPRLQQHAAVYYSGRFKQAGRKAPRFTGRAGIDGKLDLLDLELELEGVGPEELSEIWQSLKIKRRYHRLRDGSILPLEGEGIDQFARLAGALELEPADLKQRGLQLPKYQALHLDQLLHDYAIDGVREDAALTDLIRRIRHPAATDYPLPPLEGTLRGYQKTGFKWLKSLAACGFGGILADDMGLGKTLQAIAFILSGRLEDPGQPPALVVSPASLIHNWEAEFKKFAPSLKTAVIAGTKQERRELLAGIGGADVLITSYPLLRRDITLYAPLSFSSCFLDEAQSIKNPASLTARCARRIKAEHRFALTGTPIENSLTELWSIFQFIMPGYLQSQKRFLQKYGNAGEDTATLAAKVRPFILRRLKGEVLTELPPKIEHRYLSDLTLDQKKIYLAYLERLRSEATASLQKEGFNRSRIQILAGLMRLRQICCHPALFVDNYRGESAKLLQLRELLREAVDGGHRILLFSQFTGMLRLIREMLDREGYRYFYLDGSTKTTDRLQMVDAFNGGQREIFLISLRAGGTGLNLTGADIVIQYDLWWNPAVEEQAAGRAHRIGQKKVVQVIRLLARGTIEEKIFELQQQKKELIDRVIQPGETFLSSMDESDIREILEL